MPHFLIIPILTERRPCKDGTNSKNGPFQNTEFPVRNELLKLSKRWKCHVYSAFLLHKSLYQKRGLDRLNLRNWRYAFHRLQSHQVLDDGKLTEYAVVKKHFITAAVGKQYSTKHYKKASCRQKAMCIICTLPIPNYSGDMEL